MMTRVDWDAVDWSLTDAEIGRRAGRTRERVRQVRGQQGRPQSRMRHQSLVAARILIGALPGTAAMTPQEVADAVGCGAPYAEQCLRELDKRYRKPPDRRRVTKYAWASVTPEQWESMTDRDVARMLGVENAAVVAQWRRRHGILKRELRAQTGGNGSKPTEQIKGRKQK